MNTDFGYDRYGLRENPFHDLSTQRLNRISVSHADFDVDDTLAIIKANVFQQKQKAFVTLIGREGSGKTERILVGVREAEKNKIFHIRFSLSKNTKSAMSDLLQSLSPKGSTLLSNDKWEREIASLKKKVKNVYDPTQVGNSIAKALNMNVPCFILIDDLHHVVQSTDSQLFFQTLSIIMQQSIPGVLFIATVDETVSIPQHIIDSIRIIQTASFQMEPLTDDQAGTILSKHLESCRLVNGISSSYPFTSDAVHFLNKIAHGNPLLILSAANVALTAAAMQKTISITREIVEDYLSIISKQPWYENISSLVLERQTSLHRMITFEEKHLGQSSSIKHQDNIESEMIIPHIKTKKPSAELTSHINEINLLAEQKNHEQTHHPEKNIDDNSKYLDDIVDDDIKHNSSDKKINGEGSAKNIDAFKEGKDCWEQASEKQAEVKLEKDLISNESKGKTKIVINEKEGKKQNIKDKDTEKKQRVLSDSVKSTRVSKNDYLYEPEVGIINIGPVSHGPLPHSDHLNTVESQSTKYSEQHQSPLSEDREANIKDDKENSEEKQIQHQKDSEIVESQEIQHSLMKNHDSKVNGRLDRINKIATPGPKVSTMHRMEKSENIQNIRQVKVKCPECHQIFNTEIYKGKDSLNCPYCGFTGGY